MNGRMDERTDGRTDGRMDGRTDGRTDEAATQRGGEAARRFMAHRSAVCCTVLRAQAQLTLGACATQQTTNPQRATINRGALGR